MSSFLYQILLMPIYMVQLCRLTVVEFVGIMFVNLFLLTSVEFINILALLSEILVALRDNYYITSV